MRLLFVVAVAHHLLGVALETANPIWPALRANEMKAFGVVEQRREIEREIHGPDPD